MMLFATAGVGLPLWLPALGTTGGSLPEAIAPPGACDCHLHIADPRFRPDFPAQFLGATLSDYRRLQGQIGVSRAVVVQTKIHGTDHRCLVDALAQLGENGRGIGVLPPDTPKEELKALDRAGVRGLRFSVWNPADAVTTMAMIEPTAKQIADLGWHIQIHAMADQILDAEAMLSRLPCPIVFDHMGRIPPSAGPNHPAFSTIVRLLDAGRAWLKLSGPYLNSYEGAPLYREAALIARAFCRAAPERLIWGSDWPHFTERHPPDSAHLFHLLSTWATNWDDYQRILVTNPETLYGFDKSIVIRTKTSGGRLSSG